MRVHEIKWLHKAIGKSFERYWMRRHLKCHLVFCSRYTLVYLIRFFVGATRNPDPQNFKKSNTARQQSKKRKSLLCSSLELQFGMWALGVGQPPDLCSTVADTSSGVLNTKYKITNRNIFFVPTTIYIYILFLFFFF